MRLPGLLVLLTMSMTAGAEAPPDISKTLTMAKMLSLAPLPRAQFIREWDVLRDAELARITRSHPATSARAGLADARLRLAFRHAQGRVMYPFFHWRETDASEIEQDPTLAAVLAKLPVVDARLWKFAEVREYLDARVHELARRHLADDPDLARGDARWLRAKLRALDAVLPARDLWMEQATALLAKHIDDDGAYGIDEPMGWWLARSPSAASLSKIQAAIDADRAHLRGVRNVQYREVGGVPLFLHILDPQVRALRRARPCCGCTVARRPRALGGTRPSRPRRCSPRAWWWSRWISRPVTASIEMPTRLPMPVRHSTTFWRMGRSLASTRGG